jgi:ABC-2 type transport system ATP-binding protein
MAIIEVSHLEKHYGEKVAVADVSFAVEEGEIFGILGPNGAGKTTTVECVAGLRERSGGTVSVLGYDPRRQGGELREVLGLQLQDSALPAKLRVREALEIESEPGSGTAICASVPAVAPGDDGPAVETDDRLTATAVGAGPR